jgi:uncharacterized membrane protein
MEIDHALLPPLLLSAAHVVALLVLLAALWQSPWRALFSVAARQHVFFAGVFSLVVLWAMAFHPAPGITLHYLGMTAATLVFGWALASLAGALALLVLVLLQQAALDVLPLTWLLTAVVPALTVTGLLWLLERSRVRNLFVFLLGVGFAGAMLTTLVLALTGLGMLALAGQAALVAAALEHAPLLLLLLFSEGFLNGAATSTITVYFPQMVRGFNEERFLGEP